MSWSLRLIHGDLSLNGTQLSTVTDEQKLVQDLRCALLEQMGTDDMHPDFGCLLDGGQLPDGSTVPTAIGMPPSQASTTIEAEVQRIIRNYQSQQLNRAKDDRTTFNRVSLSPAEVLLGASNIQMTQVQDTIVVQITLQTARGEDLTLVFPLTTN